MTYQALMGEIAAGATIVIDGATGTELQRRGAPMHRGSWCALATETHPEVLHQIHVDYIRAGARIVTANTFATTREVLEPLGLGDKFERLNRQAVEIAVAARDAAAVDRPVLVAGSISHTRPSRMGEWSPEASDVAKFEADCKEMAAIHKAAGADLMLGEMLGDADYTPAVVRAVQANDLPIWVGLSAIRRPDGVLGTYTDAATPFADILAPSVAAGAEVYGVMHSKAEVIPEALELLKQHWSGPFTAYPDSLEDESQEVDALDLDDVIGDDAFVAHCLAWRAAGVQILGGCCGLTVSHIAALTQRLDETA